ANRAESFERSFVLIRALLVGFAGLAIVVGSFTVANSMSLLFDHRRRGFAMLRLLGASPQQLTRAAVGEALIGGATAGALGVIVGVGLGVAIEAVISATGTPIPVSGPLLTWWIPIIAIVVGMAVAVGTSLRPAREASKTPPVVAVTGADVASPQGSVGSAMALIRTLAIVAFGAFVSGAVVGGRTIGLATAGAAVALALVLIALPRLLGRLVGLATSGLLGDSVALQRLSALRSRQARTRAASTTGALLLATAVVSGLAIIASSFMQSIEGEIRDTITADVVIDSQTFTYGGLAADLIPTVRTIPGVKSATPWSVGQTRIGSTSYKIGGVTGSALLDSVNPGWIGPEPISFGPEDIAVSSAVAANEGLQVGDSTVIEFLNASPATLQVVGIYDTPLSLVLGDALIDHDLLSERVPLTQNVLALVKFDPAASDDARAETRAEVERVAKHFDAASVVDPDQLVSARSAYFTGFAKVIQWMLAFSVVLALIGVANTLQLGVNERRRELGLLRSVGGTRGQVLRLVLTEAAALSLVGSVVGTALGTAIAIGAVRVLRDYGMTALSLPWPVLIALGLGALVLSVLCAVAPALAAVRIAPLDAIADHESRSLRRRLRGPRRAEPISRSAKDADTVAFGDVEARVPRAQESGVDQVRCFACGSEPGDRDHCVVCGADLTPAGAGAGFGAVSAAAGAAGAAAGAPPAPPVFGMATPGPAPVDAVVVTPPAPAAGDVSPPLVGAQASTPTDPDPAAFDSESAAAPESAATPTAPDTADAGRVPRGASKFGSRVNDPAASRSHLFEPGEPEDLSAAADPGATGHDAEADEFITSRRGVFSAGESTEVVPEATIPTPSRSTGAGTSAAPPAYGRRRDPVRPVLQSPQDRTSAFHRDSGRRDDEVTAVDEPLHDEPLHDDAHGMAGAVRRLRGESRIAGSVPFAVTGALLEPGEIVEGVLIGRTLGMVTAFVVTRQRVLVVSERGYTPDVEHFELSPRLQLVGRHANGLASITVIDGTQVATVDQIPDVDLAIEIVETLRARLRPQ
ncbi:MAG: FtsX-like permease family protein, partial [Microthrixaceae bacterium]|nr:FtsX-like permease family protein [Microthrixaceae bacterium]